MSWSLLLAVSMLNGKFKGRSGTLRAAKDGRRIEPVRYLTDVEERKKGDEENKFGVIAAALASHKRSTNTDIL